MDKSKVSVFTKFEDSGLLIIEISYSKKLFRSQILNIFQTEKPCNYLGKLYK